MHLLKMSEYPDKLKFVWYSHFIERNDFIRFLPDFMTEVIRLCDSGREKWFLANIKNGVLG